MISPKPVLAFPAQVGGLFNASPLVGVEASKSDFSMFEAPKLSPYQQPRENRSQAQCVGMYWDSVEKRTKVVPLGTVGIWPCGLFKSCSASTTATNSHN